MIKLHVDNIIEIRNIVYREYYRELSRYNFFHYHTALIHYTSKLTKLSNTYVVHTTHNQEVKIRA